MQAGVKIHDKVPAFLKLLDAVNSDKVSPELYCRKYLGYLLEHKIYFLSIYSDVLEKLIAHSKKPVADISLIDFGAGNGLLGLFAKFCGFRQVYINDIDAKFVNAAQELAKQLNIQMDGFITGDIHDVRSFFKNELPDAIIGTDVIEHIYDLQDLFKTVGQINPSMVTVFTTASNPKNYFKVRKLKKLQRKDEHEGGGPDDFVLFGDAVLEPFIKMRQSIIGMHLKNSNEHTILMLASATRGMNEKDIITAVKEYDRNGTIPLPIAHPTNTCNPYTGSWTERILSIPGYFSIYNLNGLHLEIFNGYYDENKKGVKKILNKILNMAVNIIGMPFAPYIIFVSTKK